jgi:FixJ family two-component response regulator
MSGLNGHELLKKIKDLKKQVRTVLLTAFEVEDVILADYMKKEIINAFIQKPVRLSDLIEVVNSELHNYEIQKNISSQR